VTGCAVEKTCCFVPGRHEPGPQRRAGPHSTTGQHLEHGPARDSCRASPFLNQPCRAVLFSFFAGRARAGPLGTAQTFRTTGTNHSHSSLVPLPSLPQGPNPLERALEKAKAMASLVVRAAGAAAAAARLPSLRPRRNGSGVLSGLRVGTGHYGARLALASSTVSFTCAIPSRIPCVRSLLIVFRHASPSYCFISIQNSEVRYIYFIFGLRLPLCLSQRCQ
jgi:hypothetical protein